MAAGAGAHRDDAVDTLRGRFFGMAQIDDVVKHHAAVAMHGGNHFRRRPQTGDDDRDAVFDAQRDILLQTIVAACTI